jgi:hypothetical protein
MPASFAVAEGVGAAVAVNQVSRVVLMAETFGQVLKRLRPRG